MSVIIRLQNLPWSANALDIRSFFRGLSIPDGGVHIVGGELGDAFIAFSTDEDARQAMLLDRGKINELQIRLLLSSRTEMQKVIETARQSSLSMMQITQKQPQSVQQTQAQQMKPNQASQQPPKQQQQQQPTIPLQPPQPPQPPVITSTALKNILSQPPPHMELNDSSRHSYQSYNQNDNSLEGRTEGRDNKLSRDEQTKANIPERPREKDRVRDRDRDRYRGSRSRSRDRRRSRSRDRGGNRRRRDRTRSRSRERRDRRRHSRSRDRSRERNRGDRSDNRSRRERDPRDPRDVRDPRESREPRELRETRELREQREQKEQREKQEPRNQNDQRESRDPRERAAKDREKIDATEIDDTAMVIADDDDDDNKDIGFVEQKSNNINIWSVPPPTTTNPTSYMQGYNFFNQNQIPSYQTNISQMQNFNQMGNPAQQPPQSQQIQQIAQKNLNPLQFSQSQQLQYPKTHQQQQQQYEQFQQQIQQSSQGDSRNSPEKKPMDNRDIPQSNKKQEDEPLNFQSYFNSNLMSTFNYFGSNSKSTPFQNPYTMAFKDNNKALPSSKDENRSNTGNNFSGIFGTSTRKEEFAQKNTGMDDKSVNKDIGNKTPLKVLNSPKLSKESSKTPEILKMSEINYDEIKGSCIKISHMCSSTNYSDLRRFFSGLYIANNGIKMINDKHGLRIGVAYIRFVRPESKKKAFIRNGLALKSKRVIIESCTEEEFDEVVDSFKPARTGSGFDHQYDRNFPQMQQNDEPEQTIKTTFSSSGEKEDLKISALLLEDLPAFAQKEDIIKMFSSYTISDIILTKGGDNRKQYICYVKFHRPEDARSALHDTSRHLIGHKQIFVSRCTDENYEKAKEKYNMDKEMCEDIEENSNMSNDELSAYDPFVKDFDDNTAEGLKMSDKNDINREREQQSPQIPSLLSLPQITSDPRRRSGPRIGRFNRTDDNQIKTTFVLIKNCDYRSTKHNFSEFFAEEGIKVERIEILLNNRKQPSGECIVEFSSEDDAEKSLVKNNSQCGTRNVRIELISPEGVADRLGENFIKPTNTRNDSYPSFPPFNGSSNEKVNFTPGIQEKLLNLICNNFGNNSNSGVSNISQETPMVHKNIFGSENIGGNNNNPPRGGVVGGGGGRGEGIRGDGGRGEGSRGGVGEDNRGGNVGRRGQRKSRFSDFRDDNNRFGGHLNSGIMPQNIPPPPPQTLNNASVDQFGQPGCVVSMENVPYKAGIEDILEFFRKFNVQPQNVIRRYNDDGTPTGDARVAFGNPMEARAAIESKRNQKIFNRIVFLSLV